MAHLPHPVVRVVQPAEQLLVADHRLVVGRRADREQGRPADLRLGGGRAAAPGRPASAPAGASPARDREQPARGGRHLQPGGDHLAALRGVRGPGPLQERRQQFEHRLPAGVVARRGRRRGAGRTSATARGSPSGRAVEVPVEGGDGRGADRRVAGPDDTRRARQPGVAVGRRGRRPTAPAPRRSAAVVSRWAAYRASRSSRLQPGPGAGRRRAPATNPARARRTHFRPRPCAMSRPSPAAHFRVPGKRGNVARPAAGGARATPPRQPELLMPPASRGSILTRDGLHPPPRTRCPHDRNGQVARRVARERGRGRGDRRGAAARSRPPRPTRRPCPRPRCRPAGPVARRAVGSGRAGATATRCSKVVRKPTISTRGRVRRVVCTPAVYEWLLDHPDRVSLAWRRLKVPCVEITDAGKGQVRVGRRGRQRAGVADGRAVPGRAGVVRDREGEAVRR